MKRLVCLLVLACLAVTPATALAARETPSGISLCGTGIFVDEIGAVYRQERRERRWSWSRMAKLSCPRAVGHADVENKLAVDPARTVFDA